MTFAAPLGLLALAAAPVLLALYFLRRRSPPREVSALFLWRSTEDVVQAGPRLQRLNREVSLALELLAIGAIALFLADPRCDGTAPGAHAVVVLDGSLSMLARGTDGRRASDRARDEARRVLAGAGLATLVVSGPKPRVLAGPAASLDDALGALETWVPAGPSHEPQASLLLARELAGDAARVVFVTDAMPASSPDGIEVVAIGEARENGAFVGASREDTDHSTRLRLRVAHFGAHPATLALELRDADANVLRRDEHTLGPGESRAIAVELPRAGTIHATLPDDALPEDGRLTLVPEPLALVRIASTLPRGSAAATALARFVASAPGVVEGTPADLTFTTPSSPSPDPWTVHLGPHGDPSGLRTFVGPFFADRTHAALEDVTFDGIVWTAGASVPGRPLVTASDRTLLSEEPGPRFRVNVELGRSNVQRSLAWPLLLGNVVELRRRTLPGFARHNVGLGEALLVSASADGDWALTGPAGTRALRAGSHEVPSALAGSYRVLRDGDVAGEASVLATDAAESDLRDRGEGRRGAPAVFAGADGIDEARAAAPLVVALAALALDFAFAAPGRRRRRGVVP